MDTKYRVTIAEIVPSKEPTTSGGYPGPEVVKQIFTQDFSELDVAAVVLSANKGQKVTP